MKALRVTTDGYYYEQATAQWLETRACRILHRNYRCRVGEIDLVAVERRTLVFVEVRVRSHPGFASAAASVDWRKQQKLLRAASLYLQRQWRGNPPPCRFDVVVWEPAPDSGKLQPRWIRNAFSAA